MVMDVSSNARSKTVGVWSGGASLIGIVEYRIMQIGVIVFVACGVHSAYKKRGALFIISFVGVITSVVLYRNIYKGRLVDVVKQLEGQIEEHEKQRAALSSTIAQLEEYNKQFKELSKEDIELRRKQCEEQKHLIHNLNTEIQQLTTMKEELNRAIEQLQKELNHLGDLVNSSSLNTLTKTPAGLLNLLEPSLKLSVSQKKEMRALAILRRYIHSMEKK